MSGSIFRASYCRLQRFLKQVIAPLRREPGLSEKPVRHLRLMQLEDRRVLNASLALGVGVELTGGESLLIQDGGMEDVGGGSVQTVDLQITDGAWSVDAGIDEDFYDISADGKTLTVDQTLIDDGGAALDASDALLIQGSDAATDTVTIDVMDLDFVPSGGIEFSGGEDPGNLDNDSLEIKGYELTTEDGVADVTVTHTGAESGSVLLAGIGTIEFDEIEPLTLSGDAADLVIQLPAGADNNVVLSDDAAAGNGVSQIASPTNGEFESTTFANPTNSLTIVDGSGAKTINIEGLDSLYSADLAINADSDDTVTFQTNDLVLNGGDLSVDAGSITATTAISTSASTAGSITLIGVGDITTQSLNASGTDTGGDILVQSGSGAIDLRQSVLAGLVSGSPDTATSGSITLMADDDVSVRTLFAQGMDTGGDILVQSATGSIDTGGVFSNADITVSGSQGGRISLMADGDVTSGSVNTQGNLNGGDVLVQSANGRIGTDGIFSQSNLSAIGSEGGDIALNAGTTVNASSLISRG